MSDERKRLTASLRDTAQLTIISSPGPGPGRSQAVEFPAWLRRELESAADALEAAEAERAAAFRDGAEAMRSECAECAEGQRARGLSTYTQGWNDAAYEVATAIRALPMPTMPAPAGRPNVGTKLPAEAAGRSRSA
jgi:hypothetical protein